MSRRPAAVTQADVARVIRAAKQEGAARITVKVGQAEIAVDLATTTLPPVQPPVDQKRRIALL